MRRSIRPWLRLLAGLTIVCLLVAPVTFAQAPPGAVEVHWQPGPLLTHPAGVTDTGFGTALVLGDVNGDGSVDIVVGAPETRVADQERAGMVVIFLGPDFRMARYFVEDEPAAHAVGSSRVDLQACKLEYSIVSPK